MVLIDGKSVSKRSTVAEPGANGARIQDGMSTSVGPPTATMLGLPSGGMPGFAGMGAMGAMGMGAAAGMNPMGGGMNPMAAGMPGMAAMAGAMGGMGGGMGGGMPAGMGGNMGGGGGGGFDFFAHMAAAARMQAAMFKAMRGDESDDEEEEAPAKKARLEEEGPAFDKDALAALAQKAGDVPGVPALQGASTLPVGTFSSGGSQSSSAPALMQQPPSSALEVASAALPASANGAGRGTLKAAAPSSAAPEQMEAVGARSQDSASAAAIPVSAAAPAASPEAPPSAADASAPEGKLQAAEPRPVRVQLSLAPPEKKKDAASVSNLLQQVQSNVARGREADGKVSVQAFSIGIGAAPTSAGAAAAGGLPRPSPAAPALLLSPFDALCKRLEDEPVPPANRRAVEQEVMDMLPSLEPLRATELIVRVQAAEGLRSVELLEAIVQVLLPSVAKYNSPHLTRVLCALSTWATESAGGVEEFKATRLTDRCRAFFTACAGELALRLMDVVPQNLAQIATALSAVGHVEARLYSALARAAVARSERFLPQELISLGVAFDKAGFLHTPLFETMAKAMKAGVREVVQTDLVKGLMVLARAGVRDEELGQVVGDLAGNKETCDLTAYELCSLGWAFCTLGLYHEALFRALVQLMEGSPVVQADLLCMLYEIHSALVAFRPDKYKAYKLPTDIVQGLREQYRKHRGGKMRSESRMDRSVEKTQKEVGEKLARVLEGSVHMQYQVPQGFAVDVAVVDRKKVLVAVEIDGPHTTLQSLDPQLHSQALQVPRLRGDVMLKRRILQQNGFHISTFDEAAWKAMEESKELLCSADWHPFPVRQSGSQAHGGRGEVRPASGQC
eukprot:TRINITY_DN58281_c0_g2_i1.p1 TRINITY_DN58281_c0_g2~~TRINITY_DN58281_c0_g2_i1.p1  ORF type:complete len:847 (-),score=229.98 TRINITY_DN58281_c0_g2_i1:2166-4706(-)